MYGIHIICHHNTYRNRPHGLYVVKEAYGDCPAGMPYHLSHCWVISDQDAEKLKGGLLFLHDTKADKSFIGGRIIEMRKVRVDDPSTHPIEKDPKEDEGREEGATKDRYTIYFENLGDKGRGIAWGGKGYAMEYITGAIEVEEI